MKTVLSVFRIRFINSMQYRAVLLGDILTRFVWGLMEILAFSALYRTGHAAFSMDFPQTVSYIWMQQALYTMFIVVFGDDEIYSSIGSGSIAYELVRPVNLYDRWFSQSAANRIASTVLGCLPVLLVAFVMPAPYRMSLPLDTTQFLLFVLSSLLALCVVVAFAMLMYISLFYTLSQRGIKIIATAVTTFLSGGIIPLPFFPEPVLAVVRWLPFAAMQNMPLRIYAGDIAGMDAFQGVVFQLFWLGALVLLGRQAMRLSLKRVVVQGG